MSHDKNHNLSSSSTPSNLRGTQQSDVLGNQSGQEISSSARDSHRRGQQGSSSTGRNNYGHTPEVQGSERNTPLDQSYPGYGSASVPAPGPNFRWWVPGDGIRRDVIHADIQRYLGPDALVRPGEGRDENRGRNGYWIAAYRTLTEAMISDIKADSVNFERSGDRGRYEDSMIHRSRQHWGPTTPQPSEAYPLQPTASQSQSTYGQNTTQYGAYQAASSPTYTPSTAAQSGYSAGSTLQHGSDYADSSPTYTHYAPSNSRSAPSYGDTLSRDPRQSSGHGTQTASSTTAYTQAARDLTAAPHGYYLASDGRYYPESARPQ